MQYYNYQEYKNDKNDIDTIDFNKQRMPSNLGFNDNTQYIPVNVNKINGKLLDNIVEYNKNLTEDEINGTNVNNIIKYDNLLTLSEFDKMLMAKQYEKLYNKSHNENINRVTEYENNKFTNLSLNEIFEKFGETMMELLDEVPMAIAQNNFDKNIIMKNDRMTYVGILFVFISMFIYFILLSS